MSRIHEALRKAEQERAAGPSPETPSPALPVQTDPGVLPAATESLEAAHATPAEAPIPDSDTVDDSALTLETVLARCPQHHWNPDPKSLLFVNSHNHIHGTEEFRTLRSRLYQLRERQPIRTLLIASVLPGEGKTFTAANLAQAIVRQHERRALVIDGDLRRSQLHLSFGASAAPGLTDYLCGESDELSIIQRGPVENLFFIPGGKAISNPVELLSNGRLQTLIERLAPIFDWVLFDSPPAVAVSDASLLANVCDGVLLVVQAGKTPFDAAQKAREEFRDKPLLGVVLNRVEPGESYQSYYYSYYHKHPNGAKDKR